MKKIFAVSDVHGHYTQLTDALRVVGFDETNEDHVFISCGDLFDRGPENVRVYDFVKDLPRKILLKGNHEENLYNALRRGSVAEMDTANKTDVTIAELLGIGAVDENGCIDTVAHAEKIREITAFVDSMRDYYETETYVFTHGWLPIVFDGNRPRVDPMWREASDEEWQVAHELEWQQLYSVHAVLKGKTLVCGHRPARLGRMFDDLREPDCSEPFYGDGMIAIDAGTIDSGRVNVLVLEVEC